MASKNEFDDMDLAGLADELRAVRRRIARINTVIRQREIAAAEAES